MGVRAAAEEALADPGRQDDARLADASVLVVGAGALGSPVAMYLAGAGVGRLGIVDPDDVRLEELHAQLLHFTPDVGVPKAHSAAAKLGFLNPDIRVEPYQARFGAAMLEGQDLVVDTVGAVSAAVPVVTGHARGMHGRVTTLLPGGPCRDCALGAAPAGAIVGPVAGVVGSLMALEAIRVVGGLEPRAAGACLELDLEVPSLRVVPVQCHHDPAVP